MQLIKTF